MASVLTSMINNITIEPFCFVYFLAITMASAGSGFLYPVKVCLEEFGDYVWYKEALESVGLQFRRNVEQRIVCLKLEDNAYLDIVQDIRKTNENPLIDDVQARVSVISAVALFMQFIPAAFATLIMLNAADKIGRKNLFILPLVGHLIYNLSFLLNWYIQGSPWWLTFEAIHEFLGGRHVISIAAVLYITDITDIENRTKRINFLGLLELFGSGVGVFLAGFILDAKNIIGSPGPDPGQETKEFIYNGFLSLYVISSILLVGCILQVVFFVKETKEVCHDKLILSSLFSVREIRKSVGCVLKKRVDGSRGIILLMCAAFFFVSLHYAGIFLGGSLWLYFQKLNWTYSQFTSFLGVNSSVILIGCLTIMQILIVKFKLADMTLAIIASICNIVFGTVLFVTPYGNHWLPYIGLPFSLLCGIVGTAIKSTVTKIVDPSEITQVLAFFGMTLPLGIFGPPIFNLIYGASLSFQSCDGVHSGSKDWCTGTFIMVGVSFMFINIIIYIYARKFCQRKESGR